MDGKYSNERFEAEAIINEYLSGEFEGWHRIDNAHNDLLREVIKQLVYKIVLTQNEALRLTTLDQVERIEHDLQTLTLRSTQLREDLEKLIGRKHQ